MRLHENTDDFRDLIRITSEYVGLDPTTVEKDYWITHALYQLSNSDYMEYVVFKGGTSLTKCYEDLHRFSEDIDIALLTNDMTKSQIKRAMQKIEEVMSLELSPSEFDEACKSGDYRHTQFTYKSIYSGNLRELHPSVRFELTSFMRPHPHEKRLVGSFIEQYLNQNDMKDIIDEFGLGKFKLNVLCIERTVVEKLASLIRMSYQNDLKEFHTKTRHLYDLYMTYQIVGNFYKDPKALSEMVTRVKQAEAESRFKDMYPVDHLWHTAPLFSIIDDSSIEFSYKERFGAEFVYGNLPVFNDVKRVVFEIQSALMGCDL